jgi:hypothetical protein
MDVIPFRNSLGGHHTICLVCVFQPFQIDFTACECEIEPRMAIVSQHPQMQRGVAAEIHDLK